MPNLGRRRFLAGLGATATVAPVAPLVRRPVQEGGTAAAAPFQWGVGTFDPTPSSVLLWTRLDPAAAAGRDATLTWVLARDEALTDVVGSGEVVARADAGHCATVAVDDLPDGGRWWYRFTAPDGRPSPVGRTCTLPREPARLRLAVTSCARYADGGFAVYRAVADHDVDLVVHLGDYVYEDGFSGERDHDPPRPLRTLADYRTRYAQHRLDPDLQALHARHPMVATWDDHDIAGNAWRDGAAMHDDRRDGPWGDRVAAATQAFGEWLPGRTSRADDGRVQAWRALELGTLADLVVLDTRLWGRDRQVRSSEELAADEDGRVHRELLGEDQAAFVADRLGRDGRPPWVLLANQVMLHPLRLPVPTPGLRSQLEDAGYVFVDGNAVNPDQWDGYPGARARLLDAVGDRGGVVVLTGDVHSSWAWEGPAKEGRDPRMVELVTPSVSSATFADRIPVPPDLVQLGLRTLERDLAHVELSSHGFVLVDLTEDEVVAEWWHVDPSSAGSQHFQTARSAPREPPMRLTEVFEPTGPRTGPEQPVEGAGGAGRSRSTGDDPPWPVVGVGATAAAAAVAALVAVRRRLRR